MHWFQIFLSRPSSVELTALGTRVIRMFGLFRMLHLSYNTHSDNAIYEFSKKAVENGLDIFRVFDSLNYFGTWFCFLTVYPI